MKKFENDFLHDLNNSLKKLQINTGDTVMLHSDSGIIGQYFPKNKEKAFKEFFLGILKKLGPDGTLIVPTFSMSYTQNEPYDVLNSKSLVGPLSEFFRTKMKSKRTLDPIYSFSSLGKYSDELSKIESESCFGDDSVFSYCFKKKGKLLFMGCSFDRATFVHFVEEKVRVSYRYFKEFRGVTYLPHNKRRKTEVSLYVRNLEMDTLPNHKKLECELKNQNLLNITTMNRLKCKSVEMSDFFNISSKLLAMNEYSLINQKLK